MGADNDRKKEIGQAVKRLRKERSEPLKRVVERTKDVLKLRRTIKKALKEGPLTVPALAAAVGVSTDEALWHVMSMRNYGLVAEDEQEEDYFKYRLLPVQRKEK